MEKFASLASQGSERSATGLKAPLTRWLRPELVRPSSRSTPIANQRLSVPADRRTIRRRRVSVRAEATLVRWVPGRDAEPNGPGDTISQTLYPECQHVAVDASFPER